jgi:hypothetical protein
MRLELPKAGEPAFWVGAHKVAATLLQQLTGLMAVVFSTGCPFVGSGRGQVPGRRELVAKKT